MNATDEGRPYITHLIAEHRQLHALLREMRSQVVYSVEPDEAPSFTRVLQVLRRLHDELERHFKQEEAGGCLDEAVSRRPRLSTEAKRIEAEHPEILAVLERLIEKATHSEPNKQNQFDIERAFENLCQRILAHEKAENQVLSEGFGVAIDCDEGDLPPTPLDF